MKSHCGAWTMHSSERTLSSHRARRLRKDSTRPGLCGPWWWWCSTLWTTPLLPLRSALATAWRIEMNSLHQCGRCPRLDSSVLFSPHSGDMMHTAAGNVDFFLFFFFLFLSHSIPKVLLSQDPWLLIKGIRRYRAEMLCCWISCLLGRFCFPRCIGGLR